MGQKLLKFVSVEQEMPDKRPAEERRHDFAEIYARFDPAAAKAQASRCSQCGVPFCQVHCPLHNNIPDWLMLTAEGRLEEAYELAAATNNFPEICGRICPQDRLCEARRFLDRVFAAVKNEEQLERRQIGSQRFGCGLFWKPQSEDGRHGHCKVPCLGHFDENGRIREAALQRAGAGE